MSPALVVVGGGRMGGALVGGLIASGWPPGEIQVVEVSDQAAQALRSRYKGLQVCADLDRAEAAVLAVKPGDAEHACRRLATAGVARVVSIVAGLTLQRLEAWLGPTVAVVRAMPNSPALVGSGASAIAAGNRAGEEVMGWAEGLLRTVGTVLRLPEPLLDAVTGLSGSGPAYLFLVAEALIEAGEANGLPPQVSRDLAVQTMLGSARMLDSSAASPAELRRDVTSPGGTTEAGLGVLEARAWRAALVDAVTAATARSRELGRPGS